MQVGPIVSREKARQLAGRLNHPDVWVRRAALGALVYATAETRYLKLAEQDILDFLHTTTPNDTIDGPRPGYRPSAYWALGLCYPCFSFPLGDYQVDRHRPFLPLYRAVAGIGFSRTTCGFELGTRPICQVGDAADARLLWDRLSDEPARARQGDTVDPDERRMLLNGLARILDIPFRPWASQDDLVEQIRSALIARGTIDRSAPLPASAPADR